MGFLLKIWNGFLSGVCAVGDWAIRLDDYLQPAARPGGCEDESEGYEMHRWMDEDYKPPALAERGPFEPYQHPQEHNAWGTLPDYSCSSGD